MISIDPLVLTTITGALLPILLGFIMKADWPSKLKANLALILSLVVAWLSNLVNENGYAVFSWKMLGLAAVQWAVAVATYNGYYGQFDINAKLPNSTDSFHRKSS